MGRYQLRDASDTTVAEGTFATFDEASAWATAEDQAGSGWTLLQQDGGDWIPAQHDPSAAPDHE